MDRVSVVIPHYGDAAPTLRLVDRLRDNASLHEVIVVDDLSPEPFVGPDTIRTIRRTVNGGFGSSVNTGAAAATGDLLLILNSDLEVAPGFVDELVAASAPWQPAVTGPCMTMGERGHEFTGARFPTAAQQAIEWSVPLARWRQRPWMHHAVGRDVRTRPGRTVSVDWLVGAALLMPLAVFREAGGFDEGFYMNAEEVDLQRRLRDAGIPRVYIGSVQIHHEGGASSDPERRQRWLLDSRLRYADKWGSRAALRTALTAATAVNLLWNAGRSVRDRRVHPVTIARREAALIWRAS